MMSMLKKLVQLPRSEPVSKLLLASIIFCDLCFVSFSKKVIFSLLMPMSQIKISEAVTI